MESGISLFPRRGAERERRRGLAKMKFRLRTKLLFSLLLILVSLTGATLFIVRRTVRSQVRKEIFDDLHSSVDTFQKVQRQRELLLTRSVKLVSDLPSLRALMTTHDAATIQDASRGIWQLAGSDLFVLSDRSGEVVALHASAPGVSRAQTEQQMRLQPPPDDVPIWWFVGGHLYEVFSQPIYFGSVAEHRLLGVLALGYEVDDRLIGEVSRIASSQVAIGYDKKVILSTLSPTQAKDLSAFVNHRDSLAGAPADVILGGEEYLATSLSLDAAQPSLVQITVLQSYDQAAAFLQRLNRLLLGLGITAVFCGAVLMYFISRTFTRPLENLAAGVRALEEGDFAFPLDNSGNDEVSVVTGAFQRMRRNLRLTQNRLLESERLATIGLMASSISHDLRHPLTAILANAEFLCEDRLNGGRREDLYQEIRGGVHRMNDLIDSLLEFSRGRESLQVTTGRLDDTLRDAVHAVQALPQFQHVNIEVTGEAGDAAFDHRRLERVFYNLLLNACEASPRDGSVKVQIESGDSEFRITAADHGPGIAKEIRDRLFQPFISYGKENGTGLGLTIAQKITQDHGGDIKVVSSSSQGTTFELTLPRNRAVPNVFAQAVEMGASPATHGND